MQQDPVIVRTYPGSNMAAASARYADDARTLGLQGYRPMSQAWAGPARGRLVATPLIVIIAGVLVGSATPLGNPMGLLLGLVVGIVYLLIASQSLTGTLTVTYAKG